MSILDIFKKKTPEVVDASAPVFEQAPVKAASFFGPSWDNPPIAGTNAPEQGQIVPMMYQAWGAYGYQPSTTWYQLCNMYVSWEFTAIEKIAKSVAALPAKLYRYEKKGTGKTLRPRYVKGLLKNHFSGADKAFNVHKALHNAGVERIEVDDHPFLDLVDRPNEEMVRFNFWRKLCVHLELDGAVGIYKVGKVMRGPRELHILPTTWTGQLKPIPANDGIRLIKGYKLIDQDLQTTFSTDEIIWIHYTSLRNPYEGMSPIKAQLYAFNLDQYLMQQLNAFYKNGAMFSNLFSTEQPLDEQQYNQIKSQLQNYQGAKSAFQNFLLHSGLKMEKTVNTTASEAMIDEVHKFARDKMLSAHDISAGKIGLTDQQNRSNLEATDIGFYNESIKPRAMLITEYVNQFLVKDYDDNLDFEFDYPHFQDREMDVRERDSNIKNKITTINEERSNMGLEPVGWGDTPFVGMGEMQWSKEVPQEPVVPGEPEVPSEEIPGKPAEEVQPEDEGVTPTKTKAFWTADKKSLAWKKFNTIATAHEPLFRDAVKKHFAAVQSQVIDLLEKNVLKVKSNIGAMNIHNRQKWMSEHKAKLNDFLPAREAMREDLKKRIKPAYNKTMESAGNDRMKEIQKKAFEAVFNYNDPKVKKWLGTRLEKMSRDVTDTTIDDVKRVLREDFENGEPQLKMAEHVREYFDGAETYRADLIARTESTAAMNRGDIESVRQLGLEGAVGKIWLGEMDDRMRDTHAQAALRYADGYDNVTGKVVGLDDEFEVGDDRMSAPAEGSIASECVNCRCGLVYEPIEEGEDDNGQE